MYGQREGMSGPIHVVGPPRSGARMLVTLLGRSPDIRTDGYGPRRAVFGAADDALRVRTLAAAEPATRFVYLYRDPRETISSMLDAWRSGSFVNYPTLPRWTGPAWSLPRDPWLARPGRRSSCREIVARQWVTITEPRCSTTSSPCRPDRWCVTSYDRLLAEPRAETGAHRPLRRPGLGRRCRPGRRPPRDDRSTRPIRSSGGTTRQELDGVWPLVDPVARRAHACSPSRPRDPAGAAPDHHRRGRARRHRTRRPQRRVPQRAHRSDLPALLAELAATLLRLHLPERPSHRRAQRRRTAEHALPAFPSPMGIAVDRHRLALGTTRCRSWEYRNQPAVARKLHPEGRHDAVLPPPGHHVTGDIQVHEVGLRAATSCGRWPPASRAWRPSTASTASCPAGGRRSCRRWPPRTAATSTAWPSSTTRSATSPPWTGPIRPAAGGTTRRQRGVVLEVPSGEVVAHGLSMPHSPRCPRRRLWVLSSGRGEVCTVDIGHGERGGGGEGARLHPGPGLRRARTRSSASRRCGSRSSGACR